MDKFERFFMENRLLLNTEDFDNAAWAKIEESIKSRKRRMHFVKIAVAASIIILFTFVSLYSLNSKQEEQLNLEASIFYSISPKLAEKEVAYIQLVNKKVIEIQNLEVSERNINFFDELLNQLKVIDGQYEVYKAEIKQKGYNDELVKSIIYNYQLKLKVLQMLQLEIEKVNNLTIPNNDEKKVQINI